MWECKNCAEKHDDEFDTCWSCGYSRDGVALSDKTTTMLNSKNKPDFTNQSNPVKSGQNVTNFQSTKKISFICPIGAIVAIISFFLPWYRLMASGQQLSFGVWGGTDLGALFWISLIVGIAVLYVFFVFVNKKDFAKPVLIITSSIGLGVAILSYFAVMDEPLPPVFGGVITVSRYMSFTPQAYLLPGIGIIGTFIGHALSLIGSLFIKPATTVDK